MIRAREPCAGDAEEVAVGWFARRFSDYLEHLRAGYLGRRPEAAGRGRLAAVWVVPMRAGGED